jgi:hypothetical protein
VILPMFPLGTVLLPGQLLPLHVFEERYRVMMDEVGRMPAPIFGVVLIERGSEVGGQDHRFAVGTCARILRVQELEDERLAVIAGGTNRLRVTRWLEDDPFPCAEVIDMPEGRSDDDAALLDSVHARHRRVAAMATEMGFGRFVTTEMEGRDPSLDLYTMIAESPLGSMDRQALLEIDQLGERVKRFDELLVEEENLLLMELRRLAD